MMKLTKEQVLMLHEQLIEATGGSKGIRDEGMLVFLALNGYELAYSQQELSDTILALASGKISAEELLQWIVSHSK